MGLFGTVEVQKSSLHTIYELRCLCRMHHLDFLFITETKSDENGIQNLTMELQLDKVDSVSATGNAGGIALLWKDQWRYPSHLK